MYLIFQNTFTFMKPENLSSRSIKLVNVTYTETYELIPNYILNYFKISFRFTLILLCILRVGLQVDLSSGCLTKILCAVLLSSVQVR